MAGLWPHSSARSLRTSIPDRCRSSWPCSFFPRPTPSGAPSGRPGPSPSVATFLSHRPGRWHHSRAPFLIRLRFPIDSHQIFVLHVWQWPQCIGLFALGIAFAENGWLDPVPDRLRAVSGPCGSGGALTIVSALLLNMNNTDPLGGGMSWQAAAVAIGEGITAVGSSVWLLGFFQRRLDQHRCAGAGDGTGRLRRLCGPSPGRRRDGASGPSQAADRSGVQVPFRGTRRCSRLVRARLVAHPVPGIKKVL